MKINDLMRKDLMIMELDASNKEFVLEEMIDQLIAEGSVNDREAFKEAILAREASMSTGIGNEIAMPHAKSEAVVRSSVVFAKKAEGVEFESLDGLPAKLFFMIAAEGGAADTHLQVLASLSKLLLNEPFVNALKAARTPDEVQAIVAMAEAAQEREAKLEAEIEVAKATAPAAVTEEAASDRPFVVAVTACPTGIAHTYMAEDALLKKAAEMGVDIKVETNGSDGVKNRLTAEDIERASAVIVAAGKKVEMSRFAGKPLLNRGVADGINKAEELISKAVVKDAPIYQAEASEAPAQDSTSARGGTTIVSNIYKDVMNGISHMLPFVIGGGILLALSFVVEGFAGNESPLFTSLNTVGGAAFQFLIPVLAAYIAMSIGERPALVGGFAGGYLAVQTNAGFLGGLVAGFLAGYTVLFLKRLLKGMPQSLSGLKTILLYPVLSLAITGLLMYFLLNPIFAGINQGMINFLENLGTGNLVLLGALLGGMMAIDMGGPFNKAAYAFSIGIFTDTGDGRFMAAVMAGGMIPPLAIALASLLFKKKFTTAERQSGLTNFVMGLTFITEGALPFAAADPLRVIGSSIVGSAVAGGLTQLWSTAVPAPHGGIITMLGLGENRIFLLLAVAIGTLISAVLLGLWRPKAAKDSESSIQLSDLV